MNCVVFVTKGNLEGILGFVQSVEETQTLPVPGTLLVMRASNVHPNEVEGIIKRLGKYFEKVQPASGQVGPNRNGDMQIAVLFSMFLMNFWSAYAGPWLIIDAPCKARMPDALLEMMQRYFEGGSISCGRKGPGAGVVPVGPVVLDMNSARLKPLIHISGESWRVRGRYVFGRAPWREIPLKEYPFSVEGAQGEESFRPMPEKLVNTALDLMGVAKSTIKEQEEFSQPESVDVVEEEPFPTEPGPDYDYESLSMDELRNLYRMRKGKAPHSTIRRFKLIEVVRKYDSRTTV